MLEHESRLLLVETRLGALDHGNELLRGACVAVRELNGVRGSKDGKRALDLGVHVVAGLDGDGVRHGWKGSTARVKERANDSTEQQKKKKNYFFYFILFISIFFLIFVFFVLFFFFIPNCLFCFVLRFTPSSAFFTFFHIVFLLSFLPKHNRNNSCSVYQELCCPFICVLDASRSVSTMLPSPAALAFVSFPARSSNAIHRNPSDSNSNTSLNTHAKAPADDPVGTPEASGSALSSLTSASSSFPSTPAGSPPSLELATPTPSQSASPTADHCSEATLADYPGAARDDASHLHSVIQSQFDLEILLKHRELRTIDDEIAKIHVMMLQIKRSYQTPMEAVAPFEPPGFSQHYAQYLDPKTYSQPQAPLHGPKKNLRSMSQSKTRQQHPVLMPPHQVCLVKRADGVLVKLVCPKCARENFGSAQGFINHCRISHGLEFTTHDAAAIACGVIAEREDGLDQAQQSDAAVISEVSCLSPPPQEQQQQQQQQINIYLLTQPSTKNLSRLLRKRRLDDVDIDELAKTSIEKYPQAHLLDSEEEPEDEKEPTVALGDEATPYQRALAEAKRLRLDVDEICRTAPANGATGNNSSNSSSNKSHRKKKFARNRRVPSRPSVSATGLMQPDQLAQLGASNNSNNATTANAANSSGGSAMGGKYRPGFAPSHWADSSSSNSSSNVSSPTPTPTADNDNSNNNNSNNNNNNTFNETTTSAATHDLPSSTDDTIMSFPSRLF